MDEIDVIARIAKRAQPRQKEGTILSVHPTTVVVQPRGSTRTIICAYNGDTSGLVGKRCVYLWVQPSKKYVVSSIFNAPATVDLTKAAGSSQRRDHLIHDNVGGEFISPIEKATPVDDDLLLIEDSADLFRKKRVRLADLSLGGGGFYQTVQDNGVDQTQRSKLNFIGTTIADNPGNDSTDVTATGGGGGVSKTRGVYTQVFRQKLSVDAAEFDTGTIDLSLYEHIKVRLLQARGKHATGGQNIAIAFNGDATDANYVGVGYFAGPGFGDFINDGTADSRDIADLSAGTAPTDYRGNGEWMIGEPGVSGNGFKSIVPTGQFGPQGTGADYILTYGTMWKNTAAITRIEVIGGAGDIAAGSILEIYGFANESIGGGGGGTALVADKKSLTSGDVTVTSTSFADLDSSLDITLTTGARRCLVSWNLVVTSTGSQSQVDVEIDGARVGGSYGLIAASAASINANLSGTFLTDVLTAGSHTFKLMVRVDGATSTFRTSSTNPAIFAVEEQANTQGGSGASSPALIYDYTLPSDGTFDTNTADDLGNTGISQAYTDLELRISGIAAAGVTGGVEIFFNGDTNTAHYDGGRSLVNGGSSGGDLNEIGFVGTSGVGSYGAIIADVPGYAIASIHRTLIARSAVDGGGTSPNFWQYACQHNQAGALTRFQAHCRSAGNFAAGSRLRIYGIP